MERSSPPPCANAPGDTDTTPAVESTPTASVSTEITAISVVVESAQGTSSPRTPVGQSSGGIFRITTDGASDLIWESREDTPYDIAFQGDRDVLVATGNQGKIYRLSGDPYQPALVS